VSDATHLVPQAERLLRRIEGLEVPLVELWGWPGSGSSAVLQALLARQDVAGLALADLAAGEPARAALAAATTRRLVVAGDPREYLDNLASWLRPGQQLVFATRRRRRGGPLAVALLPPQELLLTVSEVARLWYLVCGKQPGAGTAEALWRASDGWFQPLRLAFEATGGAGLEAATAELLLEIPPVRLFLRHEVLDALEAGERERLLAAPRERPAGGVEGEGGGHAGEGGGDAGDAGDSSDACDDAGLAAWGLVEELGLWVEGGDRDRLPALLAACIERERRRRRPRVEESGAARSGPDGDRPAVGGTGGVDAHGYAFFSGRAQIAAMELLEIEHDVMHGVVAALGILGQTAAHESLQPHRCQGLHRHRRRVGRQNRTHQTRVTLALEYSPAGHHLIQHRAKGPDVTARVGFLALQLFRRHVLRRSENRAFEGERGGERIFRGSCLRHRFRKAEIEHLDAIPRQHDVLRFHVAMRYSGAMRAVERIGDLGGELERLIERESALLDAGGQCLALHVLHHHVTGSVLDADIVEYADVRMVQRGNNTRFPFEAGAEIFAFGDVFGQNLDRDGAVEPAVAGFVHLAHAAGAERDENLVRAEFVASGEGHLSE